MAWVELSPKYLNKDELMNKIHEARQKGLKGKEKYYQIELDRVHKWELEHSSDWAIVNGYD